VKHEVKVDASENQTDGSARVSEQAARGDIVSRRPGFQQVRVAPLHLMNLQNTVTDYPRPNLPVGVGRQMLNKVPQITLFFWIIKILCTTVGETFADFLNMNLGMGLTNTTFLMGSLLVVTLFFQFRARKYYVGLYWLAVVLLSVVGTLITDNLTDHFGVSLVTTTIAFSVLLALTFAAWSAVEKSLSVHTITTTRREAFYWGAILFTFALGTASGDLIAERLHLGYPLSALLFGGLIAVIAVAHWKFRLNGVLAFWLAYILTRPLGASIGDFLSQSHKDGGLGLGTVGTSALFLTAILGLVVYLSLSKKDNLGSETAGI